jgi:hypothetical protein
MNKNKKGLAVLSSAALGVLIASAVSTSAHAAVTDYVAKNATNNVINFNLNNLLADYTNKLSGQPSPMFDEYLKDASKLVAFKDSIKGYVSYDAVMKAYTDAVVKDGGKTFVMNTVTENAATADIANVTVDSTCGTDGKITTVTTPNLAVSSVSAITTTGFTINFTSTSDLTIAGLPTTVTLTPTTGAAVTGTITYNNTAKTATVTAALTAGTTYTASVAGLNLGTNNTISVPGQLAVSSVSAINAKQIQVVFNQAVDSTTATDVTNYSFKRAGQTAAIALTKATAAGTNATASLSADAKTVTITLATELTNAGNVMTTALINGDNFQAIVGTGVKTSAGTNLATATTNTVTYNDTTAPTLVSATSSAKTSTNTIKLTFSEPVLYTTASVTINGVAASLSAGANANEVTVTSGTSLTAGTTYNLSLLNFKDIALNLMVINPLATTVTVTADSTAPTVTSVNVIGDNLVEVTFDKAMNPATLTTGTVKFVDPNLTTAGTATPTVKANTTDNKTFTVAITGVTFNTAGTFTGLLSFTDSVKDATGNAIVPVTKSITLTKDTTSPTVVSSQYKNLDTYAGITNAGKGFIVVKFNEKVNTSAANTAYGVLNDLGTAVATPISAVAVNPNDPTELVLSLNAAVVSTVKSYTVVLPTSAVVDLSSQTNPSASANLTVDVSAGVPSVSDVTAPVLASATETAATTSTSGSAIALAFTEAGSGLDVSTVTNINNYRLDGAILPAGSYIEVLTPTTATIHIPAGTIAKSKSTYALNVSGIKDKAGNVMTPFVKSTITLVDDIKPVLTSGVLNTNGTVSLGFSEDMATGVAKQAGLQVKVNGSAAFTTGANTALVLADGLGSDAGKYVLSAKKSTQTLAMAAGTLTANGATYTSSIATDGITFSFIDVDASNTYTTGDILLSYIDTNAACGSPDATLVANGNYDLNNASAITITSSGTTITDASLITNTPVGNLLKGATTITVK